MNHQNQVHKKIIHFGELITINIQENKQKFICAEGIIDPTVLVCDLTYDEDSESLEEFQKKYSLQQMCNIFRILPVIHLKEQEEFKILTSNVESKQQNNNDQVETLTKQLKNQQAKMMNEIQNNNEIMQDFMGKPLSYDQSFILQHVKSYKYLNIISNDDQFFSFTNQFQLAQYATNSSQFLVKSCYKHMNQVCEYVCSEEDLYLVANNKQFKNWTVIMDESSTENRYYNYNNLFMSMEKKEKLQINQYRRYNQKDEDRIYYGDYVWIYFPELSQFWTIKQINNYTGDIYQKEQKLILKDFNEEDSDKYSMGLWIIEHEESNHGQMVLYTTSIKNQIKFGSPVRFKNMVLNQYLEVNDEFHVRGGGQDFQLANINMSINPYLKQAQQVQKAQISEQKLTLTDKKSDQTIFSLSKIGSNEQIKLTDKDIFQITSDYYEKNVSATYDCHLTFLNQKSEEQDIFQFIKPNTHELWESIFLAQSFRIVQFGSYTVKKFIKSMYSPNFNFLDTIENNQLDLLRQCIHKLVLFCMDADQGRQNFNETTIDANYILNGRKKKLQQAGYITLIARLINYCFPNEQSLMYIEQISIQQQDGIKIKPIIVLIKKFYEVTKICYQLLQLIIKDSRSSQIEWLNKINYFFHHFGYIKEADECLKTCCIENEELIKMMYKMNLNKQYQQVKLQQVQEGEIYSTIPSEFDDIINPSDNILIQLLEKLRENNDFQSRPSLIQQNYNQIHVYNLINFMIDRYTNLEQNKINQYQRIQIYEFLNFICVSRQQGFSFIQIQIYNLLNDLKYQNIFFKYTLNELEVYEQQELKQKMDIIKKYIKLMSNLSYGRNVIIRDLLIVDFPFTQMVSIIVNNKFGMDDDYIQSILIDLLTSLYIDTKPFTETILPNYICNIIPKNKVKGAKSHQLDEQTHSNIINLLKYCNNLMKQAKRNQNLNTVYQLTRLTRKLIGYKFFKIKVKEEQDLLFQIMKNMKKQYLNSEMDFNDSLNQNTIIETLRSISLFLDISHQQNFKNVVKFFMEANETHSNNNIQNLNGYIKRNLENYMPKAEAIYFNVLKEKDLEKFILNLIDISQKCNNYKIDLLVFKIIFQRIYQNTFLINHLKKILIISTQEDYEQYRQIKQLYKELLFEQECSEIWVEIPEGNRTLEPYKLASMNKFNYLLLVFIQVFFPSDMQKYTSKEPLQHKSSVMLSRQIMLRNMNVYSVIIQFIKENFELLKTVKERNQNNKLFIDIFQNCFNFLILFMSNNNTINKQLVIQIEDILLESFDYQEIGQIEMLDEIYVNNENKMDCQYQVSKNLIQKLIYLIIDKQKQKYHSRYLKFLSTIIQNQNNRINLINIIIQQKCTKDLLWLNPQIQQKGQDIFMLDFNKCDLSKQQPYLYHIEILKIFNLLFEENFKQTALIQEEIKQYITFNKIIRFLCRPDIFTCGLFEKEKHQFTLTFALKEQVMRLYSNIFKNDVNLQNIVQNSDFDKVILYFKIENEKITNLQNLRITDSWSENIQAQNIFMKASQQIIFQNQAILQKDSLQQFRNNPDYIQDHHQEAIKQLYDQLDKSQYCKFYHFYQMAYIFPFFNSIQTINLNQEIENQFLKVSIPYLDNFIDLVNDVPSEVYQEYPGISDNVRKIKEQQNNFFKAKEKKLQFIFDLRNYSLQQIIQKINIQPPIYTDSLQETLFSDKNFNLVRAIVLSIITSHDVKVQYCDPENKLILKIIKDMESSKQFKQLIYHMMKFVRDTLSDNFNKSDMLEKEINQSKDICENILRFLQLIIVNAEYLGDSVHLHEVQTQEQKMNSQRSAIFVNSSIRSVNTTQVLMDRAGTIDRNKLNSLLDQDHNNEPVALKEDKLKKNISYQQKMQNLYIDKQIFYMIIHNICLPDIDAKLFYAHIDLCISILEDGNQKSQDEIYKYFTEHNQTVNLIKRIEDFIKNDINSLQKSQEISTLIFMSIVKLSDSQNDEDNTIKLLKFVDLLTKNHHSNLQEYVIEQHNLVNSVNLLPIIVNYTEHLIKNLSENNYYKLYQCIETIIEILQGQDKKNLNLLAKSQTQLIDNIQIILEKYQSIEIGYLNYYQQQQQTDNFNIMLTFNQSSQKEKKEKMTQTIHYKTWSLFQTDGLKSIIRNSNSQIIKYSKSYPKDVIKGINSHAQDLDTISIDQLIERVMGNFNSDLNIKLLQKVNQYEQEFEPWMIRRLQFKILNFLSIVIETRQNQKMLRIIHDKIPIKVLAKNLLSIYAQYQVVFKGSYISSLFENFIMISKKAKFPSEMIIENGFKIYALIQNYRQIYSDDFNEDIIFDIDWIKKVVEENKLIDYTEKQVFYEALKFFYDNTGYVEILIEGRNHSVYFPILPYCNRNSQMIIEEFKYTADRSNQKAKLKCILDKQDNILSELKYKQKLEEVSIYFIFSMVNKNQTILRYALFILVFYQFLFNQNFLQNIIILITIKGDHNFRLEIKILEKIKNEDNGDNTLDLILLIVEFFQILISFILLVLFTLTRINKAQIEMEDIYKNNQKHDNLIKNVDLILQKGWFTVQKIVEDGNFYIRLTYFVFSVLGLFNFIFIAFLLLEIFFHVKMLQEILLSIWLPRVQILLLIFIFILIQYLFAVIAYFGFSEYYLQDDGQQISACEGLYTCFLMMFDSTFKIDGGQTGIYNINQLRYDDYNIDSKIIFDFIYVYIVLFLIVDILGGLIIDTFGQLRDEFNEREDDELNFCYICGLYRRDLSKLGKKSDFKEHITKRHDIWNYIYYYAYIDNKPIYELTSLESYVFENIEQKKVTWFPVSSNQDDFLEFSDEFSENFSKCQQYVAQKINKLDDQIKRIQIIQQKQINAPNRRQTNLFSSQQIQI